MDYAIQASSYANYAKTEPDTAADYREPGGDYSEKLNSHRLLPHLLKRIKDMGYQVTLQEATQEAA